MSAQLLYARRRLSLAGKAYSGPAGPAVSEASETGSCRTCGLLTCDCGPAGTFNQAKGHADYLDMVENMGPGPGGTGDQVDLTPSETSENYEFYSEIAPSDCDKEYSYDEFVDCGSDDAVPRSHAPSSHACGGKQVMPSQAQMRSTRFVRHMAARVARTPYDKPHVCSPCSGCSAKFARASHLRQHQRTVHEKIKDFGCSHCSAKFGQASDLRQHQRTVHEKIKGFSCTTCTATFARASDLRRHEHTVHKNTNKNTNTTGLILVQQC